MQTIFMFIKKALLILLFCCVFFYVPAQSPVSTRGAVVTSTASADSLSGNVYAIIMGVSNYQGGLPPLKFADKDALLFRDFLKTPAGGNTKPENMLLLINDSAKANDFNTKAYGWLLGKKLKKGDRLYLYFSGHGDAMSEDVYFFLPFDCEPNKDDHNYLGTGTIDMDKVKKLFIKPQTARGVDVFLIMDACRTNELPGATAGQQNFTNSITEQKMGEIMLLSTGAGQVSIESPAIGNGHGLFTYYLIDGLAGAADKDSLNGDNNGKVSLAEINAYVTSHVMRIARTSFNTVQMPYCCCPEKNLSNISTVDPSTFTAWEYSKRLQQLSADQNIFAMNTPVGKKGVGDLSENDTAQIRIYNLFADALKTEQLIGEASAETFYKALENTWPGSNLTEDAKFSLAAKYLNFCQQKINLFLSGKGLIHIVYMEKEITKEKNEADKASITELDEQIKKLKTLVTTGFDIASTMMEKSFDLLKNQPELTGALVPKMDFLKTMSAYSDKKLKLTDALQLCRTAIASDPQSAAGYQLMGWIYQDMQNDSCEYYFKKAASIAPKWAYPMNGLGSYALSKNNKKAAVRYFLTAIQLDNLAGSAYRNIGMTYYNQKIFDSAKIYFKKALDIDPCDSYANENYGSAISDYITPEFGSYYTDTIYYKIAQKFFLKSITCDPGFASGYKKMSALYSRAKKEDSALFILQKGVAVNPKNAEAARNLGSYYLNNLKDTLQAEENYKKAIELDPATGDNYFSLARLYRREKNRDKAVSIYIKALDKIGDNKDLYNELGNTYFEAPSQFETAISYYNRALQIDSNLAYVYFNLGKLYGIKDEIKDSSMYYYGKAVLLDPDRFQKVNYTISDYYYKNKKFNAAKIFYREFLDKGIATRNWLTWYAERLVTILVEEGNFTEAESALQQYLDPASDKDLYTKLSTAIDQASGKN